MNILCLLPFIPYPLNRGTHRRIYHLVEALGKTHKTTLLMMTHPEGSKMASSIETETAIHAMEAISHQVIPVSVTLTPWRSLAKRWWQKRPETLNHWKQDAYAEALTELLSHTDFDVIYCEDICMTQYLADLKKQRPEIFETTLVVTDRNRVDSEYHEEKKPFVSGLKARAQFAENHHKLLRYEKNLLDLFKHQVVCSPEDKDYIDNNLGGEQIRVIGNGFDADTFRPQPWDSEDQPVICFTGTMDYAPNVDGMHWFFDKVYPLLQQELGQFKVNVVGLNPLPEILEYQHLPGVDVTGGVPDIVPYYAACDVYIAPLRIGGGTRLKLLEAMAMKKPVVTTHTAAQGLYLNETHAYFGETPEAFANALLTALKRPVQAQEKAERAYTHVQQRFTWKALGEELVKQIEVWKSQDMRALTSGSTISK